MDWAEQLGRVGGQVPLRVWGPQSSVGGLQAVADRVRLQHQPHPSLVDLTFNLPILRAQVSRDDGISVLLSRSRGMAGHQKSRLEGRT